MGGLGDRTAEILLVEDNEGDAFLIESALKEAGFASRIRHVADGPSALEYLHSRPGGSRIPDLVLLDLNLPGMDGREILAQLKGDAELRRIPVIVLTTSDNPQDIQSSYDRLANCYVTKPVQIDEFFESIRAIAEFWFRVATLPGSN